MISLQLFYIFLNIFISFYLILRTKSFNFLTLGVLSFMLYFSPFLVGKSYWYAGGIGGTTIVFSDITYVYVNIFLLTAFLIMYVNDFFYKNREIKDDFYKNVQPIKVLAKINLGLLLLLLLYINVKTNFMIFKGVSKGEFVAAMGIGYTFKMFTASVAFSLPLSYVSKSKLLNIGTILILLFIALMGFRGMIVFSILATILLYFRFEKIKLIKYYKFILGSFLMFMIIVLYKVVYAAIRIGDFELAWSQLDNVDRIVSSFEPVHMSAIFDQIIVQKFSIPLTYLSDAAISVIPFLSKTLDIGVSGFSSYYKGVLFGNEASSFASNFWGIGFSIGGFTFAYSTFLIWLLTLAFFSNNISKLAKYPILFFALLIALVQSSFYIHRNDYIFQVSQSRSYLLYALLLYIIYTIYTKILPRKRKRKRKRKIKQ